MTRERKGSPQISAMAFDQLDMSGRYTIAGRRHLESQHSAPKKQRPASKGRETLEQWFAQ